MRGAVRTILMLLAAGAAGITGCAPKALTRPAPRAPLIINVPGRGPVLRVYGTLSDVLPRRSDDTPWLERFLYGPRPPRGTMLRNPQGMTVAGDRLFVCDQGLPDIVVVDLATGRTRAWTRANDRPTCPVDVTVGAGGRVFVADPTRRSVLEYRADGTLAREWAPTGARSAAFRPVSVLWHEGRLYVGDAGGSADAGDVRDARDGDRADDAGDVRDARDGGRADDARDVRGARDGDRADDAGDVRDAQDGDRADDAGDVRDARDGGRADDTGDIGSARILRLDVARGEWLGAWTAPPDRPRVIAPTGMAVTPDGVLLIADAVQGIIHRIDGNGTWLTPIGHRGRGAGELVRPKHVTCTPTGLVFVTDAARQSVVVYSDGGRFLAEIDSTDGSGTPFTLPAGVATYDGPVLGGSPGVKPLGAARGDGRGPDDWVLVSDTLGGVSLALIGVTRTAPAPGSSNTKEDDGG